MKNKILTIGTIMTLCLMGIGLITQGCVAIGNERLVIKEDTFQAKYSTIRQIVIEEAANNGFSTLTSEIKPSEYNNWKGRFFFQLITANGTDQFFVDFKKTPEGISVWTHGAGTRGDASSAAKAIAARLGQL
jgi:hypothetical protein